MKRKRTHAVITSNAKLAKMGAKITITVLVCVIRKKNLKSAKGKNVTEEYT